MTEATLFCFLIGWVGIWMFYLVCGASAIYFWRKKRIFPTIGCICGSIAAMPILLSLGL